MIPLVLLELNLVRPLSSSLVTEGGLAVIPSTGNVGPRLCQAEIRLRQLWVLRMWEAERSPL